MVCLGATYFILLDYMFTFMQQVHCFEYCEKFSLSEDFKSTWVEKFSPSLLFYPSPEGAVFEVGVHNFHECLHALNMFVYTH
jgi:hypothetical protein